MTADPKPSFASIFPFREFFALDVRSLALFRIGLGIMLLLDWVERLPDLRTHYSDDGIVPRSVITGIQPLSLHLYHGSVWFAGLLAGIAIVAALLLIVGWRTPLACLVSWFLLISVHARNPSLMQGGDHLLRMIAFWSIFLPLGAYYSIDASRPGGQPPSRRVLSVASFAYIAQICIVYIFAAAWKWAPEWRDDGTAIYLALNVEVFTTRFAYLLLRYPNLLGYLTHATMWLETLGPVLLFLPFHVGLQRLIAIAAFVLFHMGLALTMELGTFPFVCMVAWLPLIPGSFWDRLAVRLAPAGAGLRILADPERTWAVRGSFALRMWLLLWEAKHELAEPTVAARLRKHGGWGVEAGGVEFTGTAALARLVAASPVFAPFAFLCRTFLGRWVVALVSGRGGKSAKEPGRPGWTPPGGIVVDVVVFCLVVYVGLMNTRSLGYNRAQAFSDPDQQENPASDQPAKRWKALFPDSNFAFGAAVGIDQGWGLFAPRPGMYAGWYHAVGIRADGTRIDLLNGGIESADDDPKCKPTHPAGVFFSNRWRKMMMNLSAFDLNSDPKDPRLWRHPADPRDQRWTYSYLLPGFARYLERDWNERHEGKDKIRVVELIWWKEETRPAGEPVPPPQRIVLLHYRREDGQPATVQFQYCPPVVPLTPPKEPK